MLTTIERIDQNNEKDFLRFIRSFQALGIKMSAHYHSYGTRFPFCSFWIQFCEGKVVGALCKYYGELFVISDCLDETLEGFLRLFYEKATIWMPRTSRHFLERMSWQKCPQYPCRPCDEKGPGRNRSEIPFTD